jgi:hypothetical protein
MGYTIDPAPYPGFHRPAGAKDHNSQETNQALTQQAKSLREVFNEAITTKAYEQNLQVHVESMVEAIADKFVQV